MNPKAGKHKAEKVVRKEDIVPLPRPHYGPKILLEPKEATKDQIDKLIDKYSDQDAKAHADKVVADVFIKLTRRRSDRDAFVDLMIRPEVIESLCVGTDGSTIINGNRYYSVKETPKEILKMLKGTKASKQMSAGPGE